MGEAMENVKAVWQLIEYLREFDPDMPVICTLLDTAKTLIVVDSQGNASVHKTDRKRDLVILARLPVTDA